MSDGPGRAAAAPVAAQVSAAAGAPLPRLTSLRAVAALTVFFAHAERWGLASLPGGVAELGYAGVTFFFVLSGFVLTWSARPGTPVRTFYRRRFARVWPSHAVVLVVAALVPVVAVERSWAVALPSAALVQAWLPLRYAYGMNGVAWSLSCEAFFYAVFPAALWFSSRARPRTSAALVVAAVACGIGAAALDDGLAFHFPLFRLPEFLVGVALGLAFRRGWRPVVPPVLAAVAVVLGSVVALQLPRSLADFALLVPFALVVLAAASSDLRRRPGWLTSRPWVWAGEVSFAFYLVHELVILNLRAHVGSGWPAAAALLLVAVAVAAVLHHAVERPCNTSLRGRGGRRGEGRVTTAALPSAARR